MSLQDTNGNPRATDLVSWKGTPLESSATLFASGGFPCIYSDGFAADTLGTKLNVLFYGAKGDNIAAFESLRGTPYILKLVCSVGGPVLIVLGIYMLFVGCACPWKCCKKNPGDGPTTGFANPAYTNPTFDAEFEVGGGYLGVGGGPIAPPPLPSAATTKPGYDFSASSDDAGSTKKPETQKKKGSTKNGPTKKGSTKKGSTKKGSTKKGPTKKGPTKKGSTKKGSTKKGKAAGSTASSTTATKKKKASTKKTKSGGSSKTGTVTVSMAAPFGIGLGEDAQAGVKVGTVKEGRNADKTGKIKVGMKIVPVNGAPTRGWQKKRSPG